MKSLAFHVSPKILHACILGTFDRIETLSPSTFKNCPIWSHCINQPPTFKVRRCFVLLLDPVSPVRRPCQGRWRPAGRDDLKVL